MFYCLCSFLCGRELERLMIELDFLFDQLSDMAGSSDVDRKT